MLKIDEKADNPGLPDMVSIHGAHSGQFCNHALDRLEDIIKAYIAKGFKWIGITEHMPPTDNRFLYPDEINAGLDSEKMYKRFALYINTSKELKEKYSSLIRIFTAFETESYSGAFSFANKLKNDFKPDYIVGSVHHVHDIPIDMSESFYRKAVDKSGSIEKLYWDYFDLQYEMINILKPGVVGHFDLIRIFDPKYHKNLEQPGVKHRIRRNLERIKELDLILDFNVRALLKGASEPYISRPILEQALLLDIAIVPGDDSHGIDSVGKNIKKGISILQESGFDTNWRIPAS